VDTKRFFCPLSPTPGPNANFFPIQNVTAYRSKLVRKLEALGLKVTLEPAAT